MPSPSIDRAMSTRPKRLTLSNYSIWLLSSLIIIIAAFSAALLMTLKIYRDSLDIFYLSNEKLVQKTGLEVATDISTAAFEQAKKIIIKQDRFGDTPDRIRNIYYYDSYINAGGAATVAPSVSSPSSTVSTTIQ